MTNKMDSTEFLKSFQTFVGENLVAGTFTNHLDKAVYGLCAEVGELAGILEKDCRTDEGIGEIELEERLKDELSDVLHYCAALCNALNISLEEVFIHNVDKITRRVRYGKGNEFTN